MDEVDADESYADWVRTQRRGRRRVRKASKDPAALAKLLADMPPARPVFLRPQHDEIRPALGHVPSYCMTTTASVRPLSKASGFSFLGSFPAEIRNAIYQYTIGYPTCRELFDAYYDQVETFRARVNNGSSCGFTISLYTPTILLLCKQITLEALAVLRLRSFVIDRIPPWIMGNEKPLPLTSLISKRTLQTIRFVEVKPSLGQGEICFSGCIWLHVLEDVLRALSTENSLIRLNVIFKVSNINVYRHWDFELENYAEIVTMIDSFAFKHGSKPGLVQYEHWVLDFNFAYKCGFRNPVIRQHPDPFIWQGSVLEYI